MLYLRKEPEHIIIIMGCGLSAGISRDAFLQSNHSGWAVITGLNRLKVNISAILTHFTARSGVPLLTDAVRPVLSLLTLAVQTLQTLARAH